MFSSLVDQSEYIHQQLCSDTNAVQLCYVPEHDACSQAWHKSGTGIRQVQHNPCICAAVSHDGEQHHSGLSSAAQGLSTPFTCRDGHVHLSKVAHQPRNKRQQVCPYLCCEGHAIPLYICLSAGAVSGHHNGLHLSVLVIRISGTAWHDAAVLHNVVRQDLPTGTVKRTTVVLHYMVGFRNKSIDSLYAC